MTDWIEIVVAVEAADVDEIAAQLGALLPQAANGTEIRGDEIVFWAPLADREEALSATREVIARIGGDPSRVRAQAAMPEAEWRDAWKRYFHVTKIGPRVVIVPSWESHVAAEHEVTIDLDPGMAFGTGTHASTRLVLQSMQRVAFPRTPQVLDVGAGSGILAIAAAKLWPGARVVAIDNDPIAVDACRENCERNGVQVACSTTPVGEVDGAFDLVLANIQAHVLYELRDAIVARAGSPSVIILSGLLTPQAEGVVASFEQAGCERVQIEADAIDPQWSSAVLSRR